MSGANHARAGTSAIRAFIAIPLPPETVAQLTPLVEELRAVCRKAGIEAAWSRPEGWHLTLKFLGPVAQDRIAPLIDRLPACATRHAPFEIELKGYGAFPTGRRPRVLWIGLETDRGAAELGALATTIEEMTAALGHSAEERPYSAHLTVARIRTPPRSVQTLTAWLDQHHADRLATMRVERIALMRSDARPGGSVYTPVTELRLGS
jgi:2'-5' RNA ligase